MQSRSSNRQKVTTRLTVEQLEERCVLSTLGNPAVVPTASASPIWLGRYVQLATAPRNDPAVVFLGDSITEGYARGWGTPIWNASIAPLGAIDDGISGSTTQNILWELDTGLLAGISPRVVVLMIGTNNLFLGESPQQTAEGVAASVATIEAQLPETHVLLLGILPRGQSPFDPFRGEIVQTNNLIQQLTAGPRVTYDDIGGWFMSPNGTISSAVLTDYLHPSALGYILETAAIQAPLHNLLAASFVSSPIAPPAPSLGSSSAALKGTATVVPAATAISNAPATKTKITSDLAIAGVDLSGFLSPSQAQLVNAPLFSTSIPTDSLPYYGDWLRPQPTPTHLSTWDYAWLDG
jgi:lysophospholipase L1-like esterase